MTHAVGRFEVAGLLLEAGRGLYKRLDSARCQLTLVPSMGKGGTPESRVKSEGESGDGEDELCRVARFELH